MDREVLLEAMREFAGTILNPYDVSELLHRLAAQAAAVVDVFGVGIMLEDSSGELRFAAATSEPVVEAERRQQRAESGACFEAHDTNRIVAVDDFSTIQRWPEYRDHVLSLGLHAVLAVPMNAFGKTIGTINLYRAKPTRWTADEVEGAEILAALAGGYLVNANHLRSQSDLTEQLHAAIASRDLIGQAKGILMAHQGIDAEAAFDLLRKASQAQNRKLRDIARMVVERRAEL